MSFQVEVADIIAGLALLLSIYATVVTVRFNARQKSLIESQDQLNKLLLSKESGESENEKRADLSASFIKLGNNKHRLKIWNKGKAAARNVTAEFPEGNSVVPESELRAKFPLEILDTYGSVELIASFHMGSKRKHVVLLKWSDEFKDHNEKAVYPTL